MKEDEKNSELIQIRDLLQLSFAKWKWFVLSLVVALGSALFYLASTPNVYLRTASVLIKEEGKSSNALSLAMDALPTFGAFGAGSNVSNELIAFRSPALMQEVIKRLNLQVDYFTKGAFHDKIVYGTNLPVRVSMLDFPNNESAKFFLSVSPDGSLRLSDFRRNKKRLEAQEVTGNLRDTLLTPLGKIRIEPTPNFLTHSAIELYVNRSDLQSVTESYSERLDAMSDREKKSTVIDLSFKDISVQRAEDVITALIAAYNENWLKDKNQMAIGTSMFINERLRVIEQELGDVDENISTFKSQHLLPDPQAVSNMYMNKSSETGTQILTLNNQLYMTRYIRDYLVTDANKNQLLPINSGIENATIESQILEYNKTLLQRNGLVANSSVQNPLVINLDESLAAMRKAIIVSVENRIVTLNEQIKSLQRVESKMTSRIAENPSQEKYLLSVGRQQKVKEALYLFLLQKREENELSQAFSAYNTRIITPPTGKQQPVAPKRMIILLFAFVLGLLVPLVFIYVKEVMNNTVRGRKDLEGMRIPFIGEIPFFYGERKWKLFRKKKSVNAKKENLLVVKPGKRDVVNEAFRVLRTNLEFVSDEDTSANVNVLTSFNPNSGKSFLAINLGISLAIKDKKVLVIDGDMRNATVSSYINSPQTGLSDYLCGRQELSQVIVADTLFPNLHILPVGIIPPNPTELLFSKRLEQLIQSVRTSYDYIFIDCPPVDIVADTQIIEQWADRMLFVVRAGLLDRSMLPELETIYDEKKYKKMYLVLNGTEAVGGRYGSRYGTRYGSYYGSSAD